MTTTSQAAPANGKAKLPDEAPRGSLEDTVPSSSPAEEKRTPNALQGRLDALHVELVRARRRLRYAWYCLPCIALLALLFAGPFMNLFLRLQDDRALSLFFSGSYAYLLRLTAVEVTLLLPAIALMVLWWTRREELEVEYQLTNEKLDGSIGQSGTIRVKELRDQIAGLRKSLAQFFAHDDELLRAYTRKLKDADQQLTKEGEESGPAYARAKALFDDVNIKVAAQRVRENARPSANARRLIALVAHTSAFTIVCMVIALISKDLHSIFHSSVEVPVLGIPVPVVFWSWVASIVAIMSAPSGAAHPDDILEMSPAAQLARIMKGILVGSVVYLALREGGALLFTGSPPASNSAGSAATEVHVRENAVVLCAILAALYDKLWDAILGSLARRYLGGVTGPQGQPTA